MKKKVVSILLTATMAVGMLAGCGGSGSGSTSSAGSSDSSAASSASSSSATSAPAEDAEAEVVQGTTGSGSTKLTALFVAHPLTENVSDMKWLAEICDAADVTVEWEMIYTDWATVKSTRFAAGDIPDLLFNATIDSDYTTACSRICQS